LGALTAAALWFSDLRWWGWLLATPPLVVWLWVLWFFRDPERQAPDAQGLFISPADGTVTDIDAIGPDSPLGVEGIRIGVFMSVFSVHVNRIPFDGEVVEVRHTGGAFYDARDLRASELNEAVTVVLKCRHDGREFPVAFRQIAGLVARRIICHLKPGQQVRRGQRFGMIKFGSRGELLLPKELSARPMVRLGQKVCAGRSVLAELPSTEDRA
jgi:phosphatidylserine decarboxylase